MSRARKPRADMSENSHLTKEQQEKRELEENLATGKKDDLQKPPTWLSKVAKAEYKRIIAEINKMENSLICNIDKNMLASYCESFSNYLKATQELQNQPFTIYKELSGGGSVIAENPLINIQKKYADETRKFAKLCGISIDSRLKLASLKAQEIQEELEDEFGDI